MIVNEVTYRTIINFGKYPRLLKRIHTAFYPIHKEFYQQTTLNFLQSIMA